MAFTPSPPVTVADVEPDIIEAVVERLRNATPISAYTFNVAAGFNAIAGAFNRKWQMPQYAVVIHPAGGPPGIEYTSMDRIRLDFLCYGPGTSVPQQERASYRLYRTLKAVLCPATPVRHARRDWIASNGCMIWDVLHDGKPTIGPEPQTGWGRTVSSFIFLYGTVAKT